MSILAPVWREGILLGPQHLQQAERAADARLAASLRALAPLGHGVLRQRHDPDALAGGCFSLLEIEAVLPDGTPLLAHAADDLPSAIDLAARWPAGADAAAVHLALPLARPNGIDVSDDGASDGRMTRWRRRTVELADACGGRPRLVEVRVPALRLLLDGEDLDGCAALQVARIARAASDRFELDEASAPPCLRIDAAPAVMAVLRRIAARLAARASELALLRRSRTRGLVEFAVADVGAVLTAQAIGAHLAVLRQRIEAGWTHPHTVHEGLSALCGELLALDGRDPGTVPAYEHRRPHTALAALAEVLEGLLGSVVHTRYVPMPVQRASERLLAGHIPEQATAGAQFFLAVVSDVPAERVIRDVPLRARVAAQGRIDALIAAAMPGIRVAYVPVPPQEVPVQPGGAYFRLETAGPEWEHAWKARSLAVFLPPELAQARVEFLALKDG